MGRVSGTVADTTGAVIPGATVTVKNEKTGLERHVTASESGFYVVPQLLPGSYTVTGSMQGLSPAEVRNVQLQVGQARTVDLVMQPAEARTEVTVSAGSLSDVETESAAMGVNVPAREVANLPLNGRQISQLYLLTPGATNSGGGNFDNIRFSGRSNQQNEIRYDGVEGTSIIDASPGNLNGEISSPFRLQASLETVQEFRVESNNYPAEFGTGTGGQISVITRSGSNEFHGSLFEYLRNEKLDARNFFAGATKDKLRLNQFGGSIGGPILKEKLFFFASYEGLRQRIGIPFVEATLSQAARRQAVPAIQPLLPAFPIGQTPTDNALLDIVRFTGFANVDENQGSFRLDWRATEKLTFYARYQRDQGENLQTQNSSGFNASGASSDFRTGAFQAIAVPQNAVLNVQYLISPTMINEFKFGVNGNKTRTNAIPPHIPGVDLTGTTINTSGSVALGGIGGQGGSAGIVIPTGLVRANSATNGRGQPYTAYTLPIVDNLSVVHGNHNMKFGFEFRPIRLWTDRLGGTTYTFPNVSAFLANQPSQIQYLGDVSAPSPFNGGVTGNRLAKQEYYVGYAQDEWRIRPNLTLNYGLRYEYYSVLREDKNRDVIFNTVTGQIDPPNRYFYKSSPRNFGPRLAIAWSPERFANRTVFRVGAGYYFGPGQTEDLIQPIESDRLSRTITSGSLLTYPLNVPAVISGYDINDPNLQFQPRAYDPSYRVPERVLSYTASIQQQLPGNSVLTVAYVGSQGRNLFLRSWSNRIIGVDPTPVVSATGSVSARAIRQFGNRFAEVDYKTSGGSDNYNAMQMTFNRRFTQGFTFGSQYTWSHSLGTTGGSNEARTAQNPTCFDCEYGSNNFDVRHTFNASLLYEVPYGRGRRWGGDLNRAVDAAVGGWTVGSLINARTGVPIEVNIVRPDTAFQQVSTGRYFSSINATQAQSGDYIAVVNTPGGGSSRNIRRPDVVPGVDPYIQSGGLRFVNPAAFAMPQPG
ncbi:MAG TPA: carboxypeptidase regulatory-like domain-containing protein, partial [Bryobacteraceae bacterium]|nr:carboxypeptidase regulatory-like domain-containing protein [Bryobacteraceae bacterium]